MNLSKRITPEALAAAVGVLTPYCQGLSTSTLVEAIQNHKVEKGKPQGLQPPLTYAEFAKLTGLSLPTIHRMRASGLLPVVKIGLRSVRIPYAVAEKIINGDQKLTEIEK